MDATETNQQLLTQTNASENTSPFSSKEQAELTSTEQPSQTSNDQVTLLGSHAGKVMIVLTGQSRAGKSSILRLFFRELKNEEKHEVVEYGMDLRLTSQITGTISFVEFSNNFDAITQFRDERIDHENRYPNMIIFTARACENGMVGPDSDLRKCLKLLRNAKLTNEKYPNVIIALTHAMSLPLKTYLRSTEKIKNNIREAVCDILGIKNVKVIFVENFPENYKLQDAEKLSYGQITHQHLIKAMSEQFEANRDILGKLFCDWYCENRERSEMNFETSVLYRSNQSVERTLNYDSIPEFCFEYIGRGYCPRTENLKTVTIFSKDETKCEEFFGRRYIIPSCVTIKTFNKEESYMLTSETKDKYQRHKIATYGLEEEHDALSLNVDLSGKWLRDELTSSKKVIFVHEKRLVQVKLDVEDLYRYGKQALITEFRNLPNTYKPGNWDLFNEFFSKWGTHYVSAEFLGGYIEVELLVGSSTYTQENLDDLKNVLQSCFLVNDWQADPVHYVSEKILRTYGGEPSTHTNTLQEVTEERLSKWKESLTTNPAELKHCFKLQPYYNLVVDEPVYSSIKEATKDYLSGVMALKEKQYFSVSAKIYTKNGSKECGKLRGGCKVRTANYKRFSNTVHLIDTEFCSYLHCSPTIETEFLVLKLANGHALTVSKNVLIFVVNFLHHRFKAAKDVRFGDWVVFVSEDENVTYAKVSHISTKQVKGICFPKTYDGTLIVDGAYVSCGKPTPSGCSS